MAVARQCMAYDLREILVYPFLYDLIDSWPMQCAPFSVNGMRSHRHHQFSSQILPIWFLLLNSALGFRSRIPLITRAYLDMSQVILVLFTF